MRGRRVVQQSHGGPEVLEVVPLGPLVPADEEVVVRVAATSINPIDIKTRNGGGAAKALGSFPIAVGWDVAGVVERVGAGVRDLAPGQRVFGMPCFPREAAAYATHVLAPAGHLAPTPDGMDDLTAGALPLAGLTALSALRDCAGVAPGQRVLLRGAAGGVGHLAIQVAKILGATVVAVVRADQAEFVRSLGADEIVERSSSAGQPRRPVRPVDVVVDLVGGDDLAASVRATRPGGVVVCVPGGTDADLDQLASTRGVRAERTSVRPDRDGLSTLARWALEGALRVHIDEVMDLEDVAAGHRRLEAGGVRGKLAVRVS